jgi:hypothetical protein
MNVEIGAEAALFPEKEYISGIFVKVQGARPSIRVKRTICLGEEPSVWVQNLCFGRKTICPGTEPSVLGANHLSE